MIKGITNLNGKMNHKIREGSNGNNNSSRRPFSFNAAHSEKQIKQYRVEQLLNNQKAAVEFMESLLNYSIPHNDLHSALKDGIILCEMLNQIQPGIIKQISKTRTPFNMMSNIFAFLNAATKLGLDTSDLFETVDLYEGKDMSRVFLTILAVARKVCKVTFPSRSSSNRASDKSAKTSPITNEHIFVKEISSSSISDTFLKGEELTSSPQISSPEIDLKANINGSETDESLPNIPKVIGKPKEMSIDSVIKLKKEKSQHKPLDKVDKRKSMLPVISSRKDSLFEESSAIKANHRRSMLFPLSPQKEVNLNHGKNLNGPNLASKELLSPTSPSDKIKNLRMLFDPPKSNNVTNSPNKLIKHVKASSQDIKRMSNPDFLRKSKNFTDPKIKSNLGDRRFISNDINLACEGSNELDNGLDIDNSDIIIGLDNELKSDSGIFCEPSSSVDLLDDPVPTAQDRVRKPQNYRIGKGGLIEDLDLSIKKVVNDGGSRNDVLRLDAIDWNVDDDSFISRAESMLSRYEAPSRGLSINRGGQIDTISGRLTKSSYHIPALEENNLSEEINGIELKKTHSRNKSERAMIINQDPLPVSRPRSGSDGNKVYHSDRLCLVNPNTKTITQYQLGDSIGKGQFGVVYKALNMQTGQIVAVKRIELDGRSKVEAEALMGEVDLLKSLTNVRIVNYVGCVQSETHLDILLEFVENGSLLQLLRSYGTFSPTLISSYTSQILEGLIYLHGKKVVHCDLKAANILTTKDGKVKLTDFGVSLNLKVKSSDHGEIVAGTPNWMAPEVISLQGASTASDIWSLGCTIIELLTGKPPYADLNPMTALFRIVEDACPPLPKDLPEELEDFLLSCFYKEPELRPTAEELFYHDWIMESQLAKDFNHMDLTEADKQKEDSLRDLEITDSLWESCYPFADNDLITSPDITTSMRLPDFNGNIKQEHQFVKSMFEKPILCKICRQYIKKQAMLCDDCGLICHSKCASQASNLCHTRSEPILHGNSALMRSPIKKQTPLTRPLYSRKYSNRRGLYSDGAIATSHTKWHDEPSSSTRFNSQTPHGQSVGMKGKAKGKKKKRNDDCKIA